SADRVSDDDASQLPLFRGRARKRRTYIYGVVTPDEHRAGLTELGPRRDEPAILIEHLHAIVLPIGNIYPATRSANEDVVRLVEAAGRQPLAPPRFEERPFFRDLPHAPRAEAIRIVAVGHEDAAVQRNRHARRSIERVGPGPGHAFLPQDHQDFAFRTELEHFL